MLQVIAKSASTDFHHPAQHGDRKGLHLLTDKAEPHFDSSAAAFYALNNFYDEEAF